MQGIASDAQSWTTLLLTVPEEFDAWTWTLSEQNWRWADFPRDPARPEMDELDCFEEFLTPFVTASETTSEVIIHPGGFRAILPYMGLDEWTYLTGYDARNGEMECDAEYLSQEHFDFVEQTKGLLIFWIDGWWEIFPANHPLLAKTTIGGRQAITESLKWTTWNPQKRLPVLEWMDAGNPAINV